MDTRAIDNIGYTMVADAYFPALTAAVRRYDSTGVMPMYMILHDQYFYEVSDGRLWLTILEDPLNASMRIKGDDGTRERHLRDRQNELRAAVASSRRLQQDAKCDGRRRAVAARPDQGARERRQSIRLLVPQLAHHPGHPVHARQRHARPPQARDLRRE